MVKINELPDTFNVRVVANAIQLEQVVNLLTNAIQAMDQQDDKQLSILLRYDHQAQTQRVHCLFISMTTVRDFLHRRTVIFLNLSIPRRRMGLSRNEPDF